VLGGVSYNEIAFVALLVAIVLLSPHAPRIGERLGGLFEKGRREKDPPG
jgi:hypothetical protein